MPNDYYSLGEVRWTLRSVFIFILQSVVGFRGTGIRGLMRGMATIPQGKQELLVVKDKVGRPQVSLG